MNSEYFMPEIQIRSYQQPKKDTPPGPAPDGGRHEATPTDTLTLISNFFPEYFRQLEAQHVSPAVFRGIEQLSIETRNAMENAYESYKKGLSTSSIEISLAEACTLIALMKSPLVFRKQKGIGSIAELEKNIADRSEGQAGPGTSL